MSQLTVTYRGFCIQRVDGEHCGARTLPGNTYCIEHRVYRLKLYSAEVRAAERELQLAKARLEALLAEGVPK